jgi:hypothetical protein
MTVTRLKVSHDEGLTFSTINFPLRSRDNILSYDALGDRLLVGARESGLFFQSLMVHSGVPLYTWVFCMTL